MAARKKQTRPGGDERRDHLVQAAFACLAADGFEGLRTRCVADRAGVNIATLHYYFPTKEALIGGVAAFIASRFITLHAPRRPSTGSPALDRLQQEFADVHFYRAKHPDLAAVLIELQLRGRRDPAVRKIIEPMFGHWRNGIEEWMAAGIAEGVFRPDLDAAGGAAFFVGAMIGAGLLEHSRQELDVIFAVIEAWLLAPAAKPVAGRKAIQPSCSRTQQESGGNT
jgi:TetR/AcrR family transcriptional regulator, regulator of cefoperazone and chloramphenicol sensitivity